jgi:hypothetical protein
MVKQQDGTEGRGVDVLANTNPHVTIRQGPPENCFPPQFPACRCIKSTECRFTKQEVAFFWSFVKVFDNVKVGLVRFDGRGESKRAFEK